MRYVTKLVVAGLILLSICAVPLSAQAPDRSGKAEWLVKGSLWSGMDYPSRPRRLAPRKIALTVLERNGNDFKGDLYVGGRHIRYVAGRVTGEKIEWNGAPGEQNQGKYNVGTIRGKRIDIKYYGAKDPRVEDGTFFLEYQGIRR